MMFVLGKRQKRDLCRLCRRLELLELDVVMTDAMISSELRFVYQITKQHWFEPFDSWLVHFFESLYFECLCDDYPLGAETIAAWYYTPILTERLTTQANIVLAI